MIDLGWYKTFFSQTFRCHFDPEKRVALARGPLPGLAAAYTIGIEEEKDAAAKLAGEIGKGVFIKPIGR